MINKTYFADYLNSLKLDVLDAKIAASEEVLSDSMCGRERNLSFGVSVYCSSTGASKTITGVRMTCITPDNSAPPIRQFNTGGSMPRKHDKVLPECASCLFHLQHANDYDLKLSKGANPQEVVLGQTLEKARLLRFLADVRQTLQTPEGIEPVSNLMEDMYEYLHVEGGPIPK